MENIFFKIKTFGQSRFEKIISKFENILKLPNNYKYSIYKSKKNQYVKLKEKKIKESDELSRILRGELRTTLPNIFEEGMTFEEETIMNQLKIELSYYSKYFQDSDVNKLINFITPALENNETNTLKFIDLLGCENIKPFNEVIKELELSFLKNEITKQEIQNIKKFILSSKGLIDITI